MTREGNHLVSRKIKGAKDGVFVTHPLRNNPSLCPCSITVISEEMFKTRDVRKGLFQVGHGVQE